MVKISDLNISTNGIPQSQKEITSGLNNLVGQAQSTQSEISKIRGDSSNKSNTSQPTGEETMARGEASLAKSEAGYLKTKKDGIKSNIEFEKSSKSHAQQMIGFTEAKIQRSKSNISKHEASISRYSGMIQNEQSRAAGAQAKTSSSDDKMAAYYQSDIARSESNIASYQESIEREKQYMEQEKNWLNQFEEEKKRHEDEIKGHDEKITSLGSEYSDLDTKEQGALSKAETETAKADEAAKNRKPVISYEEKEKTLVTKLEGLKAQITEKLNNVESKVASNLNNIDKTEKERSWTFNPFKRIEQKNSLDVDKTQNEALFDQHQRLANASQFVDKALKDIKERKIGSTQGLDMLERSISSSTKKNGIYDIGISDHYNKSINKMFANQTNLFQAQENTLGTANGVLSSAAEIGTLSLYESSTDSYNDRAKLQDSGAKGIEYVKQDYEYVKENIIAPASKMISISTAKNIREIYQSHKKESQEGANGQTRNPFAGKTLLETLFPLSEQHRANKDMMENSFIGQSISGFMEEQHRANKEMEDSFIGKTIEAIYNHSGISEAVSSIYKGIDDFSKLDLRAASESYIENKASHLSSTNKNLVRAEVDGIIDSSDLNTTTNDVIARTQSIIDKYSNKPGS